MISVIEEILPYIGGLWTLPWIIIGLVITMIISNIIGEERVRKAMKKIGLVLLFVFIPLLLFRIFLNIDFGSEEINFAVVTVCVITFMYLLSYLVAHLKVRDLALKGSERSDFLKTILTNQGRSAAFVGGAMLAIEEWRVPAGIYISLVGIGLFAVIPYILSIMHKKEVKNDDKDVKTILPWYLRAYPWYLLSVVIAAVVLHKITGVVVSDFGDAGTIFHFLSALTVPAGLYYVGAGIHPRDLKFDEVKKLFLIRKEPKRKREFHWIITRNAFLITLIITPVVLLIVFGLLYFTDMIPSQWFAVIMINSIMPITSTNMFLIPYGIDRKGTALAVTWTTVVSVPLLLILIPLFSKLFI